MYRYKDIVKLLLTVVGFVSISFLGFWYAGEQKKDELRDRMLDCQNRMQVQVRSHEERIHAVEKWLENNSDMPEVMAKIEANTGFMSQRMNEIYHELRDLRKKSRDE